MRIARRTPAVLLLAVLTLSACGGGEGSPESEPSASAGEGFPATVTDARGEVTLDAAPQRIVSLSPSSTEMLFAIGAGDQVVAADEYSNFPEEAPTTDLSGFTPSVEAISEHDPDLVVLARDAEDTAAQLDEVEIPVLVMEAAVGLDDTYAQMRLLGEATGHAEEADAAATEVENEVDEIVATTREELGETDLTYYHELDAGMYSVTSETFIGQVYSEFGLENIADAAEDTAGGYPQLSAEFVVEQNPDLVFLAYGGEDAAAELAERPAFDTVTAVENGDVVELDPDIASRWGPRVVDLAESVSAAVTAAQGR
ncbi:ABC transporter substrate-binding protein [Nocardiopsis trehalosi]|uniref:ABC transporter substrate-binding protein n=1 Tax=Nocardiopsis trehalosi TaxID=109329 RepID=UPI00083777FA|nr:ABC transporter substrate-binding protein [Nocardiopsis trehalosi]